MGENTQCAAILIYLNEAGPITAKIARRLCGCERLAARIHVLRKKGIPIKTTTHEYIGRTGYPVRYAEYSLEDNHA